MNRQPDIPAGEQIDALIGELIAFRWSDDALNLGVFGNRVGSDQYRIVYRAALEHLPGGAKVLDWGCGNGHFSYFLMKMGFRVTGFSFLDHPRLMKPFEGRFRFVRGSDGEPRSLPFASGEFDAVVSMGVLEHVRETGGEELASLAEIRRILKPGGVFVCAHFPNRRSWVEFLTRHFFPSKFNHRYRFSRGDISELWGLARLEIRGVRRYGWLPRNTSGVIRSSFLNSPIAVRIYGVMEQAARLVIYPFHQNFLVVAVKPQESGGSPPARRTA